MGPRPGRTKTAVDTILVGKDRAYNRRFQQMCGRHLVEPVACTPASGWEKGQVENQVGLVRERLFTPRIRVKSYDELNALLLDGVIAYAKAHPHPEQALVPPFDDLPDAHGESQRLPAVPGGVELLPAGEGGADGLFGKAGPDGNGGDGGDGGGVLRLLVRRHGGRLDARADLHGEPARLRRSERQPRPVRDRAAPGAGARH